MSFTINTSELEIECEYRNIMCYDSKGKCVNNKNPIIKTIDVPACCGALFIYYDPGDILQKHLSKQDYINFTINYFLKLDEYLSEDTYDCSDNDNHKLWMVSFNPNIIDDKMLNEILAGLNMMFIGKTNDGLILLERQHYLLYHDEDEDNYDVENYDD